LKNTEPKQRLNLTGRIRHLWGSHKSALRIASMVVVIATALTLAWGCAWLYELGAFGGKATDLITITNHHPADNSIVYDRHGQKLGEIFSKHYVYVPYTEIPPFLVDAVLSTEDRSFWEHSGIDVKAMFRALLSRFRQDELIQGGSTITQQVVRHFLLTKERTITRKLKEITLARQLETKISKERILEIYLNSMFLGNGSYGVGAAAVRYFNKELHELDRSELAVLAGLFQSPSKLNPMRYPKRAKQRQLRVLRSMAQNHKLTQSEARKLGDKKLNYVEFSRTRFGSAPHFVDYIEELAENLLHKNIKNQGLRIYTTLDSGMQRLAENALNKSIPNLVKMEERTGNKIEAAFLATDSQTGEILAMIGGRDYGVSQFNRAVQAKRQPGSAFKPAVYSLALSLGARWSDLNYVSKVAIKDYRPENAANYYLTETTLLHAFFGSLNTPAVELGEKIGIRHVLSHAAKLGIKTPLKEEAGTILGSSEVSLLDLNAMYATFVNQGVSVEPIAIRKVTDREGNIIYEAPTTTSRSTVALSPQVAYLTLEGLRSVLQYGTGRRYSNLSEYAVGKTGTSDNARDNWFAGSTARVTATAWVGNDESNGLFNTSGAQAAMPIWADFIASLPVEMRPPFAMPENIVSAKVSDQFGYLDENGIPMYFIKGTEPKRKMSNLKTVSKSGSYRNVFE
jgi:penicillin-binding protein 1A